MGGATLVRQENSPHAAFTYSRFHEKGASKGDPLLLVPKAISLRRVRMCASPASSTLSVSS